MDFTNYTVLITGSSRGLGKAIAIEFAKKGANIVINYLNSSNEALMLQEYLKKSFCVKALAIKADITNIEEVKAMICKIEEEFTKIDILVNNAGIAIDSTVFDKTKENFMKILETNLVAPFIVSREVGNIMLKRKQGVIINISSTNGMDTEYVESLDYDASKAGLNSLTKNLANYYAPYIRVNAVAPGWINTDMNKNLDDEFIKNETSKIMLGRFAEPSEIAKIVVFLASSDASYINGTIIRADGGYKNV